ncbi:acyltransferase [Actibacterium sp. MT2.3-13A]|uniref:acyltransferase family protein n=1 Tax=Actibacterium sp. MT2.3-13A TaxID=2828332 RepID=UPI001BABD06B|nr:acyltransferase [Actibacterium sp. MT2.3-13A]
MGHYFGIDLLRWCAAILVVVFHLQAFGWSAPEFPAQRPAAAFDWLAPYGWFGWVGVQIFFVISGFVIAASAKGARAGAFLLRRAIRVFPALWAASLIALAVRAAWGEPLGALMGDFSRSVILSPWGPHIDGVIWTLVVEAAFYGLIAAMLAWRGADLRFDRLAYALGGASTLFLLLQAGVGTDLFGRFHFDVLLLRHGVFFALGMLIWAMHSEGRSQARLATAGLFAATGVVQLESQVPEGKALLLPALAWSGGVALMLVSLRWDGGLSRPGRASVIRQLGLMTYPLYLCHFTLGMYATPWLAAQHPHRGVVLAGVLALIILTSWAVMRGPEQALQRRARGALRRREAASRP